MRTMRGNGMFRSMRSSPSVKSSPARASIGLSCRGNDRMKYWLVKSEPDDFSIDALQRVGVEPWNGVRNYQARNYLRQMKVGDGVLFYHSSCPQPGVVGVAKVEVAAH